MVKGRAHGISRYVTRLAEGLALLSRESSLPYEPVFLRAKETPEAAFSGFGTVAVGTPFLSPAELALVPLASRRARASAFHSPSFVGFTGATFGCPWIVTIHDLIHLEVPGFSRKTYYEQLLRPFAKKARACVTVSEFSRGELLRWLGGEAKVEVAANALDERLLSPPEPGRSRAVLERLGLEPGKFIFCLSNPKPHKNVELLLEAYSAAPEGRLPLVLGGVTPKRRIAGIRAPQGLSDEDCHALWHHCATFAFPSKAEGFGLPPAEAAVAGAPLLVSDIPPLREALAPLGGGAAVDWLDPGDAGAWTRALSQTKERKAQEPAARKRLLEAYSVRKLGQAMDRIYRRVLELTS
jgi:glycosyltransferase involved in cell wall biosynthesis